MNIYLFLLFNLVTSNSVNKARKYLYEHVVVKFLFLKYLLNTTDVTLFHPIVEINAIKYFLVIKQQFPLFHENKFCQGKRKRGNFSIFCFLLSF